MKNVKFAVILLLLCSIFGQTGPGGVCTTDGTSDLVLWLDASAISGLANEDEVAIWTDQSGYGYHLTQTEPNNQPLYIQDILNGRPVIDFDGTGDYLRIANENNLNTINFTLFIITKTTGNNGEYRTPLSTRFGNTYTAAKGYNLYAGAENRWEFWWSGGGTINWKTLFGSNDIETWTNLMAIMENSWGRIYEDGEYITGSNTTFETNTYTDFSIGGKQDMPGSDFGNFYCGQIAEIILFKANLNEQERIIVENYLAAKYGLSTETDIYSGDSDGDYDNDVAGIGKSDDGSHLESNSGGLIITDNNFLQDSGDYLMVGHKMAENSIVAVSTTNTSYRWNRAWYTDLSGGAPTLLESIDLAFDFSEGGFSTTPAGTYYLIKSSDDGTTWSEIASTTTLQNTDQVLFSSVPMTNFNDGDIITISSGYSDMSLPVSLASFDGKYDNGSVKLTWITTCEICNRGFILERKQNSESNWTKISDYNNCLAMKGQGSSTDKHYYSYTDSEIPVSENIEYRLADVSEDGIINWLKTLKIDIDKQDELMAEQFGIIDAFPNPFNPSITLKYRLKEKGNTQLSIFNLKGELVHTIVNQNQSIGMHDVKWNPENISAGLYIVVLKSENQLSRQKIMYIK